MTQKDYNDIVTQIRSEIELIIALKRHVEKVIMFKDRLAYIQRANYTINECFNEVISKMNTLEHLSDGMEKRFSQSADYKEMVELISQTFSL